MIEGLESSALRRGARPKLSLNRLVLLCESVLHCQRRTGSVRQPPLVAAALMGQHGS